MTSPPRIGRTSRAKIKLAKYNLGAKNFFDCEFDRRIYRKVITGGEMTLGGESPGSKMSFGKEFTGGEVILVPHCVS